MENILFRFAKVRDVESPIISTDYSVGIDFFIPKCTESFVNDLIAKNGDSIVVYKTSSMDFDENVEFAIKPHKSVLIPSGLKIQIPSDKGLAFGNRSSVASKKMNIVGAYLVDPDYQNEVFFNIINLSDEMTSFKFGDKLIQGEIVDRYNITFEEVKEDELVYPKSNRVGGFGSTN